MTTSKSGINASNLTAQIHYRARGNPPATLPDSAISNCFPGLEFDFRNAWRRMLAGITLSENNNFVLSVQDPQYADLAAHRLLKIEGLPLTFKTTGVTMPYGSTQGLATGSNPNGVSFMEWSNSLARFWELQGKEVQCTFTKDESYTEQLPDGVPTIEVTMVMRHFFETVDNGGTPERLPVIAGPLLEPGDLTHGLCAPWQNDYRECACYYWAASRPDYVNVVDTGTGSTTGDMWLAKRRTGVYILDDRTDSRLWSYDDLFKGWQEVLRFQIGGFDAVGFTEDGQRIPPVEGQP